MNGYGLSAHSARCSDTILAVPTTNGTMACLAMIAEVREQAYRIRHDGYLSYGYITPRDGGLFSDAYDGAENERTVVIYQGGIAAATIRICLHDPKGIWPEADRVPAMEIFRDEVLALEEAAIRIGRPGRVIEITRFARDPAFANDKGLIIAAFRIVAYLRLYFDADIMINAVRPHHMPMYRRLGFEKIEEPRQYPNLTYRAGLMAMFPERYALALKKIGFPSGVSNNDMVYTRLLSGDLVPVFPVLDDMSERLTRKIPAATAMRKSPSHMSFEARRHAA